jgi:hypothetical protein
MVYKHAISTIVPARNVKLTGPQLAAFEDDESMEMESEPETEGPEA